ncbi:MAG: hypothetical protein GY796_31260 [Chloroflexi bacterium]|nr:hypothetical protein [Chloroflexota bacterium]
MTNEADENNKGTGLFKQVLRGRIAGEREEVASAGLTSQMALLRSWQVERLTQTYNDLLQSKRYGRGCQFFLSDIYGAKDYSQRDADAENVYNNMRKYFPNRLLVTMGKAIELNKITQELDAQLLDALVNDLQMTNSLSVAQYAEAYRICDNNDARVYQLDVLLDVGRGIGKLIRLPMIGMALRAARRPAHRSGWHELQDFMERGFVAFKQMKGVDEFMQIVEGRERQILGQIFAGKPNPFDL